MQLRAFDLQTCRIGVVPANGVATLVGQAGGYHGGGYGSGDQANTYTISGVAIPTIDIGVLGTGELVAASFGPTHDYTEIPTTPSGTQTGRYRQGLQKIEFAFRCFLEDGPNTLSALLYTSATDKVLYVEATRQGSGSSNSLTWRAIGQVKRKLDEQVLTTGELTWGVTCMNSGAEPTWLRS